MKILAVLISWRNIKKLSICGFKAEKVNDLRLKHLMKINVHSTDMFTKNFEALAFVVFLSFRTFCW